MKVKHKRWLEYLGWLIVSAALAFLVLKGWQSRAWFAEWRPNGLVLMVMFLGMAGCAGTSCLLAVAWSCLIKYWEPSADFWPVFKLYARTQIAKYIPGNVFHFAGRWLGGYRMGLAHQANMGATLYEIAGLVAVAAPMAAYGFLSSILHKEIGQILLAAGVLIWMLIFPFLAVKMTAWIAPRFCMTNWPLQTRAFIRQGFIPAYFAYVLLFLALGLLFAGWTRALSGVGGYDRLPFIISVFATAWLIGFIVPGASGGLGVREAVIVGLLGGMVGEAQSVIIALSFRLITVGGDVLFFMASIFSRPSRV